MICIVTDANRYKRPPRKRKAVALEVPAGVTRSKSRKSVSLPELDPAEAVQEAQPGPVSKSVIVTIRRKSGRFGNAPDLTPEEIQRRGDAADALFRGIVRAAREGRE